MKSLEIDNYEMNDSEVRFVAEHIVREIEIIRLDLRNISYETFSHLTKQIGKRNNQVNEVR